jgi:hypothetical protein
MKQIEAIVMIIAANEWWGKMTGGGGREQSEQMQCEQSVTRTRNSKRLDAKDQQLGPGPK